MNDEALRVAGFGLCTAAGDSPSAVYEAIRADVRFAEPTYLVGLDGEQIKVAHIRAPEDEIGHGLERAALFTERALDSCFRNTERAHSEVTALVLCFSIRMLGPKWDGLGAIVADQLARSHGVRVPSRLQWELEGNQSTGIRVIARARELLLAGEADEVLVVGVHSACSPGDIVIRSALFMPHGTDSVPGEGAAIVRLKRKGAGARIAGFSFACSRRESNADSPTAPLSMPGLDAPAHVVEGVAKAAAQVREAADPESLTTAMEHALRQWQGDRRAITATLTSVNGEPWRAKEWALASTRVFACHKATPAFVAPAMTLGDFGAATAPLLVALAAHATQNDQAARMVTVGGPGDERGAVIVAP